MGLWDIPQLTYPPWAAHSICYKTCSASSLFLSWHVQYWYYQIKAFAWLYQILNILNGIVAKYKDWTDA